MRRHLGAVAFLMGCSSGPVMSWDDSKPLVHCYLDGERVKDRREVERLLGSPCRTETDDGPADLYLETYYCAIPKEDGWVPTSCDPGCTEFRWAFVGITPVSCKPR